MPFQLDEIWQLSLDTLTLAITSALMSLLLALPIGYWLASLTRGRRRLVQTTLLVPFLLPPFLVGGFLIGLLGRSALLESGWLWLVVAHVLMNIGFLGSVIATALSGLSQDLIDEGRTAGANAWQLAKWVELPMLRKSLGSATLLVAIYSSTSYGLVLMIGGGELRTLEVAISQAALQRLDLSAASVLAGAQLLLSALLVLLAARLSGDQISTLFGPTASGRRSAGWFAKLTGWVSFSTVVVFLGTLLLGAFRSGGNWRAGGEWTLGNFANLTGRGGRDILNLSLIDATLNSLRNIAIALLIATPIAWLVSRRPGNWHLLTALPLGVSPVVFGLAGLVATGQLSRLGLPVELQWLMLPALQSLLVLPLLIQLLAPARKALDREVLEAAAVDGAGRWQTTRWISLPLLHRPVSLAMAIGGLAVLGEFGAASFFGFGSQATLSVALGRLLGHPGAENLGMFSAAAAILVLLSWVLLWLNSAAETAKD